MLSLIFVSESKGADFFHLKNMGSIYGTTILYISSSGPLISSSSIFKCTVTHCASVKKISKRLAAVSIENVFHITLSIVKTQDKRKWGEARIGLQIPLLTKF